MREPWRYKVEQICQTWRHLVFAHISYLHLCLVCTHGTSEAVHPSPPPFLPDINYLDEDHLTTEDKGDVILAMRHRDHIRRVRLEISVPNLQRFIMAMDEIFPVLNCLYLAPMFTEHWYHFSNYSKHYIYW